jgi:hypothetical protein
VTAPELTAILGPRGFVLVDKEPEALEDGEATASSEADGTTRVVVRKGALYGVATETPLAVQLDTTLAHMLAVEAADLEAWKARAATEDWGLLAPGKAMPDPTD